MQYKRSLRPGSHKIVLCASLHGFSTDKRSMYGNSSLCFVDRGPTDRFGKSSSRFRLRLSFASRSSDVMFLQRGGSFISFYI